MKVIAVIPALFVLVSLCGSPVPPPPGTVTGTVFFDANRNGIRDPCDSPMRNTQVVVNASGGRSATGETIVNGTFAITDAPAGDGDVSLVSSEGAVWPITTNVQRVHVDSNSRVDGIQIGTASRSPYDSRRIVVSGVVFWDSNEDGTADDGECPIYGNESLVSEVRSGDATATVKGDGSFAIDQIDRVNPVLFAYGSPPSDRLVRLSLVSPTSGFVDEKSCSVEVEPVPRYGPNTFEANLGFGTRNDKAVLSGGVFEDQNGNGVLDANEDFVSSVHVTLEPVHADCIQRSPSEGSSDQAGRFHIESPLEGDYSVTILSQVVDDWTFLSPVWSALPIVSLKRNSVTSFDVPMRRVPAGSVSVLLFDDDNSDGLRNINERSLSDARVCIQVPQVGVSAFMPPRISPHYIDYTLCADADDSGLATLRPVMAGTYEVQLSSGATLGLAKPAAISVDVGMGEAVHVGFPLTIYSVAEQIIEPGAGESLPLSVCDSDPEWVQRAFDDGFDTSYSSAYGVTREHAQLIYGHGIYLYNGFEMNLWSQLAQAPWRLEKAPSGCGYSYELLYIFAGYEPLEIVTAGNILQVKLGSRSHGLYVLNLPYSDSESLRTELFVDEDYVPIVRCGGYYGCEWNDGSATYDQRGY